MPFDVLAKLCDATLDFYTIYPLPIYQGRCQVSRHLLLYYLPTYI